MKIRLLESGLFPLIENASKHHTAKRPSRPTEAKGEVLFISQRQLLTFGEIEGVDLVPENELVFLMEMAMSNKESAKRTKITERQSQKVWKGFEKVYQN